MSHDSKTNIKRKFTVNHSLYFIKIMASTNWSEILEQHFPPYKVEVTASLDTVHISNSTDISIEKIYEIIKENDEVPEDLKLLYHESVHGTDKNVKLRMRNHIGNFKRGLRFVIIAYTISAFLLNFNC